MAALILRAGPLSAHYAAGSLRGIRLEGREVLRHVYIAVRDQTWKTIPARLSREVITDQGDRFRIELAAEHVAGDVDFVWEGVIEGDANGAIRWSMSGEPRRTFRRNRIGFCVLHPIAECAGMPCILEHSSGAKEYLRFPSYVAPHQPFLDIRSLSHEVRCGLLAEVRLTGEVFETEDHRNWTDYSFKTYSTPLALPYPVLVHSGERMEQTVALTLHACPVRVQIDRTTKLKVPELDFRRMDLRFDGSAAPAEIEEDRSRGPFEIALFTDDPAKDLPALLPRLRALDVRRYLVFTADGSITTAASAEAARGVLGNEIPVGGGSNVNFAELNRNRTVAGSLDFLSWAISPSAHAEDALTMIENLQGQGATVECARVFAGGKPLRISGIKVPAIPAAAGWLAGSISHLGQAGVASIGAGHAHPLLDEINAFHADSLLPVHSSDPNKAYALVLESGGVIRAWLANFSDEPQTVEFEGGELLLDSHELRRIHLGAR